MTREFQINSDAILWNDFIKGKEDAFRVIYMNHVQALYRFGCHFTDDKALIKDSIHDVFIELHKYRLGLSKTNNIRLYLFKALKRKIIKSTQKRGVFGSIDIEKLPFLYTITAEEDLLENESEQLKYQQLNQAMSKLSPRQKEAIYLKFVSDLSYEDLGKVMKLNYQSARNLVFRGLEKLRESFHKSMFLFFIHLKRNRLRS